MNILFFLSVASTALSIFIIVYAYSLNFFPKKWRKKVDQDTLVGLALIFSSMLACFCGYFIFILKYFNYFLAKIFCKNLHHQ